MKQQSPMLRLWELGEGQQGGLKRAVLSAVVGVLFGMLPYFAVAQIILGLLSGNQESSFYLTSVSYTHLDVYKRQNLNRAFPGNSAGPLSARLAFALEAALYPEADLLADLHSGDCSETLHPLVFFPAAGKKMVNQVSPVSYTHLIGVRRPQFRRSPSRSSPTTRRALWPWRMRRST